MKILVAPWGWPQNYREVPYRIEDKIIPSRTATGALKGMFKPDHTVLIFPESLSVYNPKTFQLKNHKEIAEALRSFLIREFLVDQKYLPDFNSDRDHVLIAPASGTFVHSARKDETFEEAGRLSIKGALSDYFSWVYYQLSNLIFGWIDGADSVEILLDLSHGLNFMSTLTYSALYEIGSVIEIKLHNKVTLKLYNADPYYENPDYMEINLVKDIIPKINLSRRLPSQKYQPVKVISKKYTDTAKNLGQAFSKFEKFYKNDCFAFWGAFSQGIPLGVFRFKPSDRFKEILETAEKLFKENIKILYQGEKKFIIISKRLKFTDYFDSTVFLRNLILILDKISVSSKNEIPLENLKAISEQLYKNFPAILDRINYEVDDLPKSKFKERGSDWEPLGKCGNEIHRRNFLAHAGLSQNAIEYRYFENKWWVRYCKDSIDKITGILIKINRGG